MSFLLPKHKRKKDTKHLAKVRRLPCMHKGCGVSPCDPNHKLGGGMGYKADDDQTFPLCREHHTEFHRDPVKWQEANGTEDELIARTQEVIKIIEHNKEWYES